jgi:hypothetical protein
VAVEVGGEDSVERVVVKRKLDRVTTNAGRGREPVSSDHASFSA